MPNEESGCLTAAQVNADAYFAGLLDGEGCVAAIVSTARDGTAAHPVTFEVRMTAREPILALKEEYGGSVYLDRKDPLHPDRKSFHTWVVHGPAVIPIASRWFPFLRVKKRQVEVAAELARTFIHPPASRWTPLPHSVKNTRVELAAEIRALNRA